MKTRVLSKKISTSKTGVFYKQIVNENNKEVDRVYLIRYKTETKKDKLLMIGKKSEGVTIEFSNQKRMEILTKQKFGEEAEILRHKRAKKVIYTLDKLAEIYFEDRETSKKQQAKYYNHIKPFFGDRDIKSIKKEEILEFRKELLKGTLKYPSNIKKVNLITDKKSKQTVNGIIELLKTIYNYNIKENKALWIFVNLSLQTGGRLETILNIQKKDIDLINSTITLKNLKNKETYKGFLQKKFIKYLEDYLKNLRLNDYVVNILDENIKTTSRQIQSRLNPKLDKLFNSELDRQDRKNRVVIHTLRHTFASNLAINGTPIFTIQKLMNHKDIKQTMRYAKLAPDSGKEFVNELYK